MKNFLFALSFIASTILSTVALAGPSVTLKIGKPSQSCRKFGFCWIKVGARVAGQVNGTLDLNDAQTSLTVTINADDLATVQPDKTVYFDGDQVTFEERQVLSDEVNAALGAADPIAIEAGSYPLTRIGADWVITIPVSH